MNVFIKPEIANNYDDYYQSDFGKKVDKIEQNIISSLIKEIPKNEMLELGCGTGHWSEYFSKKGFKLTGIDISDAMLNIAKRKNINAKFKIANSQNLPFNDESFQIISSITMLGFVNNQDDVIKEIYRVLKKGGWLILGCLNEKSIIGKNKGSSETFKKANFLTINDIQSKLNKFETLHIKTGVYLKPDYAIMDNKKNIDNIEPAFIGILAQKK